MSKSPVPKKKSERVLLNFPQAMVEVITGNAVTKLEWDNTEEYVALVGGFLCIHHAKQEPGVFDKLLVSEADLVGKDWYVRA